jgi:hypothetical protein
MSVTLEVLHVSGCPGVRPLLERLRQVTELPVTTREISSDADAAAFGMAGSPTLLVDGRDPFADPAAAFAIACRIFRDEHGGTAPVPSVAQLRRALRPGHRSSDAPQAAHQTILRTFAATGRPPERGALDDDLLAELHDLDAIRIAPDGRIAVAHPFSVTPTRHRVRIGDRIEVHAMCAIDALGIAPMLGEDTRIDSVDVTSGLPIGVAMTGGSTTWDPADAVVFVGMGAGCCCDHLNFFTDIAAAQAWSAAHPEVPGRILTPVQAEALATRLFGRLLA